MPMILSPAPPPVFKRTMCFIDGAYLRRNSNDIFKHDNINKCLEKLHHAFAAHIVESHIVPQFVRIYYYDAIVEPNEPEYEQLNEYFNEIRSLNFYEVKLGRLIKNEKGPPRQKGVDVLLSIDMLKKAYENHYEYAVLVAGDDDYVDLVKAVKDTGRRVYGFYFAEHISQRLKENLDWRCAMDKTQMFIDILK